MSGSSPLAANTPSLLRAGRPRRSLSLSSSSSDSSDGAADDITDAALSPYSISAAPGGAAGGSAGVDVDVAPAPSGSAKESTPPSSSEDPFGTLGFIRSAGTDIDIDASAAADEETDRIGLPARSIDDGDAGLSFEPEP